MCGICGQYNFMDGRPASRPVVEAMTRAIVHRGPDDEGFHLDGALMLGFRRLSIIDLAGGHQPMADAQGQVWVAFNGEVFNFPELRKALEGLGHVFRTRSDTEVIVHGYRQWGTAVLGRLNGMFGLAIWDAGARRLVLARDAAGIKPLYYRVDDGGVLFGSEIRAVLAALPVRPQADAAALNLLLRYRYIPAPWTAHEGVCKLAPGEMAVFEPGRWQLQRWDLPCTLPPLALSDDEAAEALLDLYQRALERHLLSDVPVGLLLSGGVDSGLLLGLMGRHDRAWPTYTIGYGRAAYKDDELLDAARTAALYGARHRHLELGRGCFEADLARVVAQVEEPIASSSVVQMFHVCELARQDVKVALVGQGPDELFGGYKRHLGVHYGQAWRRLPSGLRRGVAAGLDRLPRNEAVKRALRSLDTPERLQRYRDVFSLLPGADVDALFHPGVLPAGHAAAAAGLWQAMNGELAGHDELGGFQLIELRSALPDELLMFTDKLSMAHGLEVRVPYLDREIVAFVSRLPARFKVRHGQRKWLHRRVCERFLPHEVLARKKRGFGVDAVDDWLQAPDANPLREHLLDEQSLIYRLLQPAAVQSMLRDHMARRRDCHKLLFTLVALETWLRAQAADTRHAAPEPHPPLAA
jgi:asparagine synthase (glutamine-hydrolysing)